MGHKNLNFQSEKQDSRKTAEFQEERNVLMLGALEEIHEQYYSKALSYTNRKKSLSESWCGSFHL